MAANPNTMAGIPETWEKEYQIVHDKVPVYPAISNYRLASGLKKGDTVHRQYPSSFVANVMGADGSYATQALVDTDETLVINKEYETSFYIKELDELQNSLPVRSTYARRSMIAIFNQIDGDILGLYDQFTNTLDDGDMGGTAGNGVTVTTANVKKLFFTAKKILQKNNILLDNGAKFTGFKSEDDMSAMGVAVISPDVYQTLLEAVDGKDTAFGDAVAQSGHAGMFAGFNLFVSNALGWSAQLEYATIATDTDTIVINGVTLTADADGAAVGAGHWSIEATNDLGAVNLVNLINGTGTPDTVDTYIDVSAANRLLLKNITATYNASTDMLTLKATGKGSVAVSETLTPAGDIWTPAKQIQHCLFGKANAIDVVIQKEPSMRVKDAPAAKVGYDFITWTACGYKVFNEGLLEMVDVQVRTDAY
jgi:hypothetical protein